jgi:hypothetical protein
VSFEIGMMSVLTLLTALTMSRMSPLWRTESSGMPMIQYYSLEMSS